MWLASGACRPMTHTTANCIQCFGSVNAVYLMLTLCQNLGKCTNIMHLCSISPLSCSSRCIYRRPKHAALLSSHPCLRHLNTDVPPWRPWQDLSRLSSGKRMSLCERNLAIAPSVWCETGRGGGWEREKESAIRCGSGRHVGQCDLMRQRLCDGAVEWQRWRCTAAQPHFSFIAGTCWGSLRDRLQKYFMSGSI